MNKFVALLLTVFICAMPVTARAAAEPYEINVIVSLTGIAAFLGNQELAALKALEVAENKRGGIAGRPIKFVTFDDASNPVNSVQLANTIIAKNVPVIMGPTLGAACEAVYAMVKNGPVEYCFAPTLHPAAGSFGFSGGAGTNDLALAAIRYYRERGWKRVAMITSTDASGQDGERVVTAALALPENKSMTLVANEHFAIADVSVGAQLARIKAANPQAVVTWTTGTPTGTVLRALHDTGIDLPTVLNAGNIVSAQLRGYASFLPTHLYLPGFRFMASDFVSPGPVKTAQKAFFAALAASDVKPEAAHTFAWDPARIVIETLRHLGPSPTAVQLRDALEATHGFAGINSLLDFRDGSQRGVPIAAVVVIEWNGALDKFVPVSKPGGLPLAK